MKYYWWFMVITAFSSNSILTATIDVFSEMRFDDNVFGVLTSIADAVPTKVSATVSKPVPEPKKLHFYAQSFFTHLECFSFHLP